jgi:CRP/FNR family transcriptional regulator, anaerobic regulatory protein
MNENGRVPFPYRQQDIADALGLSLVHTNKTLAKLRESGVATVSEDGLIVHKPAELHELAQVGILKIRPRPLI